MRSRGMSGASMLSLALGVTVGVAAGLLAAPMRGSELRGNLRSRAQQSLDRARTLFEEGRRAFNASRYGYTEVDASRPPFGEIAAMHGDSRGWEARS